MFRKLTRGTLTLVVLLSAITLSAQKKEEGSPVLMTVGNTPVTADEVIYLYRKPNQNKPEDFTREKIESYIELFTKFKLKVEEAKARGYDTTAAFKKEYNGYREELRKPYLPDGKLVDSLTLLTYNRLKEEIHAAHILINLPPDASPADTLNAYNKIIDLRKRILQGEDFGNVAAEFSEDPTAKMNKGNLGYFTAMQMVFPFEQAAYSTPVGQVSMPVRTRFGYHLIYVIDRRPASGEVEVSHIMIKTGPNMDNDKARNTIFEVYEKLQKGMSWEELCKEYSEDPSSKDNAGKLRPFGIGTMAAVPQFEEAAFNLKSPGDISDPIQTAYGWHIIRLVSKISLPSYEQLSTSLKSRVSRDERVQVSKQAVQARMKKEFGLIESVSTKEQVLAMADSTLQKGKWRPHVDAIAKLPIVQLKDQTISVSDFVNFVYTSQKPTNQEPKKYLEQLYNQFIDYVLGNALEEKIKLQHPEYGWLLKEYYEGILMFEIMEKEVWNKSTEDSIGQLKYYEANKSKYQAGERVQARLYSNVSVTVMDQIKNLLESGDSTAMADWIKKEKVRQETGNFEKADRAVLGKVNWAPGIYKTENNGQHYVVWIRRMIPPGNRTFAEARATVISDYQAALEERWLNDLRKKYKVKINKKGKEYLMNELLKTK